MKHPFVETAELLRDLARVEHEHGLRDEDGCERLRAEARELERLAGVDRLGGYR